METKKVLALAREAGGLTDIRTSLNVDGDSIIFTPEELIEFAALIQREMEAENVCICGFNYDQHTYDKNCDSHGVCPDRQGVFRNERQHELVKKLEAENAELRKDAEQKKSEALAVIRKLLEALTHPTPPTSGQWEAIRVEARKQIAAIDREKEGKK